MAWNTLPGGFTAGTGTEIINFGMTGITNLDIWYKSTTNKPSEGHVAGGNQFCYPDNSTTPTNKALVIKDSAGTIIFDATWTSFTGTTGVFTKNVNTLGVVTCLFKFGNV